jgi:hypothetical protein
LESWTLGRFIAREFADRGGCDVLEGAGLLQDGAKRDDLKQQERAGGFPVLRLETPGAYRERHDRSDDGLSGAKPGSLLILTTSMLGGGWPCLIR